MKPIQAANDQTLIACVKQFTLDIVAMHKHDKTRMIEAATENHGAESVAQAANQLALSGHVVRRIGYTIAKVADSPFDSIEALRMAREEAVKSLCSQHSGSISFNGDGWQVKHHIEAAACAKLIQWADAVLAGKWS